MLILASYPTKRIKFFCS